MAELNDKLITYGNLSTFYDKLQEQGLGGNAIEEVSELPNASENKDKLFRLDNGDKDVYVAKLLSSETTTTNRLPDEQQIDKAYLYELGKLPYYYKGSFKVIFSDTEIDGYGWLEDGDTLYFILTEDDAVNIKPNSIAYGFLTSDKDTIDLVNKTITTDKVSTEQKFTLESVDGTIEIPIPAIYNAPESTQIGNAYIHTVQVGNFDYRGNEVTVVVQNGTFTGYSWTDEANGQYMMVADKPASELYFSNDNGTIMSDYKVFITIDTSDWDWTVEGNTWTNLNETITPVSLGEHWSEPDSLYIPQLNAPDSEQVGHARLMYEDVPTYKYLSQVEVVCSNGNISKYLWADSIEHPEYNFVLTTLEPSNIYGKSVHNTIEIKIVSNVDVWGGGDGSIYLRYTNGVLTFNGTLEAFNNYGNSNYNTELADFVKYQRTVVTEEWGWQPLTDNATNDDIDAMFASEIKLIRAQEDDENYIDWLVNTSGETMEFNGQTYYKWVVWGNDFNDGSGPAVENPNALVLTNTLNVQLPFNFDSPEFEYMIVINSEEMTSQDYIHGDYTQKTVQ